jgi:glucose/arabinose dehydrogenase/PKD repeat protein
MGGGVPLPGRVHGAKAAIAAVLALAAGLLPAGAAATVPPGFDDQHVLTIARPTALTFAPDGRMLIITKDAKLYVVRSGSAPQLALDLSATACFDSERGGLGIAVDPQFAQNRFVFLYYTFKKFGVCESQTPNAPVNRISRFVLPDTDVVDPAGETVLVDNIPSPHGIHNAGDLEFRADGYLYATTGDGGCDFRGDSGCILLNDASRDLGGLSGKLLRITRDGSSPADNPFVGSKGDPCRITGSTTTTRRCTEVYAYGLRNPFRFAIDPGDGRLYLNDVGEAKWEEIDRAAPGADFGWNVREGPCARDSYTNCGPPPAGMTNPIYSFPHTDGCTSITAGAFVPAGVWPAEHDGAYIYGDLVCHKFFELRGEGAGATATEFGTDLGLLIDAAFGPHGATQALYYIRWGDFPNDQIRRISHVGAANRAPEAVADASPRSGDVPLSVQFDGSASTDADGDPLTYEWDFGDGSPTTGGAQAGHTYTTAGTYTATLRVSDGRGGEDTATVEIRAGNEAPAPTITSPAEGQRFGVGETIVLSGSASDPEDGPLPPSALSWEVIRHHDTHTHPFVPPTTGSPLEFTGPAPEDIHATTTSYLEVSLTATDSDGLSTTVTRDIDPRLVDLTFESIPTGLQIEVAGSMVTAPATVTSWDGWQVPVNAPDQTDPAGSGVTFVSWSDGGTRAHDIATPAAPATYTARFTHFYPRPKSASPVRFPLVVAYASCEMPNIEHGPPLAEPSCTPPVPASSRLTTGTPDANGQQSHMVGHVRLAARPGDPATPADETDVALRVSLTDVRRSGNFVDYAGELELVADVRATDRLNGPGGAEAGTLTDQPLRAVVPCAATPQDPTAGSTCALDTTLDALVPGIADEGSRSLWELVRVTVNDGGPDGEAQTQNNTPFVRPGIFIP